MSKKVIEVTSTLHTDKEEYKRAKHLDHILHRPDTYIGSVRQLRKETWCQDFLIEDSVMTESIYKKYTNHSPGLVRIFIEPLSNAIDNYMRSSEADSKGQSYIKVHIASSSGMTTFKNDGRPITLERNRTEGIWNPELIFGNLLTSSNYDDSDQRFTSGRNGYGIKLTNIFSTFFQVKCCDGRLMYTQTFQNNMRHTSKPIIKKTKENPFTEVTYIPDFERFGCKGYDEDMMSMFRKLCYDTAMITGLTICFNTEDINVSIDEYCSMYTHTHPNEIIRFSTSDSDVIVVGSDYFFHMSFVNGIHTDQGGVHLDVWSRFIFKILLTNINLKLKATFTISEIKRYFGIFVISRLVNPEFKGQDKTELIAPKPILPKVLSTKLMKKILEWRIIGKLEDVLRLKELSKLKKTDSKKGGHLSVKTLEDANFAGTVKSSQCKLFITEGLSAKTFAKRIMVCLEGGTDIYGVYPIKGKFLNTRNVASDRISKNKEVTEIKQALGLKYGIDYTENSFLKNLRYGKLVILADADNDGIHICGLILNFIHSLFPSLVNIGFVEMVRTPIVKIYRGKEIISLYDQLEYEKIYKQNRKDKRKLRIKYYKGLGTWSPTENEEYGKEVTFIEFKEDDTSDDSISMAFHESRAAERKQWLLDYSPDNLEPIKIEDTKLPISTFVHNELIRYSTDALSRSIPSIIDGLKPTHRKILYSSFKRRLNDFLKVAQFAGYVAEHTSYKHAETSISGAIIKMGRNYVGSNNIPFFSTGGNFGTRDHGGEDASAPRYIHVKINPVVKKIFKEDDLSLLNYLDEEGQMVEPEFYLPVIPFVLVNGAEGIGTGFSTYIPCYKPSDIIKSIKAYLETGEPLMIDPWYKGFKGTIEGGKSYGILKIEEGKQKVLTAKVTELPIGLWKDKFREHLLDLKQKGKIKNFFQYGGPDDINYHIKFTEYQRKNVTIQGLHLVKGISTSNMVLFDTKGVPKRYESVCDIIREFTDFRIRFYQERKKILLEKLNNVILEKDSRARYIREILEGKLILLNRDESDLITELGKKGYYMKDDSFSYLLDIPNGTLTKQRAKKLENDLVKSRKEIDGLVKTEPIDMFRKEMGECQVL